MALARLYGRTLGEGSHVQVTRGFELALREAGLLAGLVALDEQELDAQPGALAQTAIFTGPLHLVGAMRSNARHEHRWTMVAPNSDRVPSRLFGKVIEESTALLAPSAWAEAQLRKELERFSQSLPVKCVPHGILPGFEALDEVAYGRMVDAWRVGDFRVLHLATSDRQRKGTRELIQAWVALQQAQVLPAGASLSLVLDPEAHAAVATWMAENDLAVVPGMRLVPRLDLPAGALGGIYHSMHVVCQPSRGEGFGLVPLEARATGTVVVATRATGHTEHLPAVFEAAEHGCVLVPTGALAPIDDVPGAVGPTVAAADIAVALRRAHEHWQELSEAARSHAATVRTTWSWPNQLRGLLNEIQAQ